MPDIIIIMYGRKFSEWLKKKFTIITCIIIPRYAHVTIHMLDIIQKLLSGIEELIDYYTLLLFLTLTNSKRFGARLNS